MQDDPRSSAPRAGRPPTWRRAVRWLWLAVVLAALAAAVVDRADEVGDALARLAPWRVAVSGVAVLAGVGASLGIWREVLAGLGFRLQASPAAQVFFVGQLGKYLPGSVWPVLAQMELARDRGVPPRVTGTSVLLFLWVHLCTGAAGGAGLLAAAGVLPGAALLVVPVAVGLLAPGLLAPVLRLAGRLSERLRLEVLPSRGAMLRASAWALAMWACYGVHLWLLADGVSSGSGDAATLVGSAGAYAAAWVVGFVVVVVPAGAGVREAVLVATLPLATGPALAVAVVARVGTAIADLAWASYGLVAARRRIPADGGQR